VGAGGGRVSFLKKNSFFRKKGKLFPGPVKKEKVLFVGKRVGRLAGEGSSIEIKGRPLFLRGKARKELQVGKDDAGTAGIVERGSPIKT